MTYSIFITDYGPIRVGPMEESVFLASRHAKELGEPTSHPAIQEEERLAAHLMAIGERFHQN